VPQNWDGTGGNGSALRHFELTGSKYPLVVKLGTITPHGADVYSYAPDENDMVTDPKLREHLAHWGVNMMQVGGEACVCVGGGGRCSVCECVWGAGGRWGAV
jgi:uncharacterized UBP type Zn finger protein